VSSEVVSYAVSDGVATIAMDQPHARNALSNAMLDGLTDAFVRAREDPAVRICVLASTHPATFSSGEDLAGFAAVADGRAAWPRSRLC